MPESINAAISKFDLDSQTTIHAACPSCHFLYKPTFKIGSTVLIYPKCCANNPHLESPKCGNLLLHGGSDGKQMPIKPFVFHDFNDYLAGVLSQSDLEEAMLKNEWWLCRLLFVAEMTRHKNDTKKTGCGLKRCRYR